jgi:hypothetical protein
MINEELHFHTSLHSTPLILDTICYMAFYSTVP